VIARGAEKEGIPLVLLTIIESTASMIRANYILIGRQISHAFANSVLSVQKE